MTETKHPLRRSRYVLFPALLSALLVLSSPGGMAAPPSGKSISPAGRVASEPPLTVRAGISGGFGRKGAWNLVIHNDQSALLSVQDHPQSRKHRFKLSATQIAQLRRAVAETRFFEWDKEIGSQVPDSSVRTLSITQGKASKTVTIYFLRREAAGAQDVKRVVRLWKTIQSFVHDKEAVDLTPYDARL